VRHWLRPDDEAARKQIGDILDYINRLYTVYTRIFVYDVDGCIVASTQPGQMGNT